MRYNVREICQPKHIQKKNAISCHAFHFIRDHQAKNNPKSPNGFCYSNLPEHTLAVYTFLIMFSIISSTTCMVKHVQVQQFLVIVSAAIDMVIHQKFDCDSRAKWFFQKSMTHIFLHKHIEIDSFDFLGYFVCEVPSEGIKWVIQTDSLGSLQ